MSDSDDAYDRHHFDEFEMPEGTDVDRFFGIGTADELASPHHKARKMQERLRRQREHVVVAERAVSKHTASEIALKDDLSRLVGDRSASTKEVRLLERKVQSLESALTRQNLAARKGREAARVLQQRLSKAQTDEVHRREQDASASKEQGEQAARLDAATEELALVKRALKEERSAARTTTSDVTRQLDEAEKAMLRLRKERATLLAAFEKQSALITALKQQKLHVEAATLLQITRDEFVAATRGAGGAPGAKGRGGGGRGRGRGRKSGAARRAGRGRGGGDQ